MFFSDVSVVSDINSVGSSIVRSVSSVVMLVLYVTVKNANSNK